jgi:hypothetical protein
MWALNMLGAVIVLLLVAAVTWYLVCPATSARRAYEAGLTRLGEGDTSGARERFEAALARDPNMAPAAFCLGFTYLGGQGRRTGSVNVESLLDRARRGETLQLDASDAAFARCIASASHRPPDAPVRTILADTNRKMLALAWNARALNALTRAAAAVETGHPRDGDAWVAVASEAITSAEMLAPGRDTRALRELARQLQSP